MERQLKNLQIWIYVITGLLIFNTIILFISLKDPNNSTTPETESEESYDYDVSMFDTITADEFVEAYNGSEMKVVYFGRATCGFCVQFLPVLQQAQEEYGYTTLYVDISTIDADGESKISELNSYLSETYGQTPNVVIVQNGQIVDYNLGYTDYSTFASMLESNGFTK